MKILFYIVNPIVLNFIQKLKTQKNLLSVIIVLFIWACSGKNNNSKVAIQEGLISLYQNDTISKFYNILEVNYEVQNDTSSLEIVAVNRDSSNEYLIIGLLNIVNLGEIKYSISDRSSNDSTKVYVALQSKTNGHTETIYIKDGNIDIVSYTLNSVFQAKLNLKHIANKDTIHIVGEVNLDFTDFDVNRIPNVPIPPGTLHIETESGQLKMTCVASYIVSVNKYIINGITNGNENLVITVDNFKPKMNFEYIIGEVIDSVGIVYASFNIGKDVYVCNGQNSTSGKLTIKKITFNSLQGYFECIAYNPYKKSHIQLKNGIFYAKLKLSE